MCRTDAFLRIQQAIQVLRIKVHLVYLYFHDGLKFVKNWVKQK